MFYKKIISFKKAGQKGVFAAYQVKGLFTDLLCNLKIEYTMVPVQTPTQ